jgi:histidinol dehydrogenase
MRILRSSERSALERLITRDAARRPDVEKRVARIVADVRRRGDAAVRDWRARLDGARGPLFVTPAELRRGRERTPAEIRAAIALAVRHVARVAEYQRPRAFSIEVCPGVRVEQRVEPLGQVGCYVPGGRFPLVSSAIMTIVPARVAGVEEITMACPAVTPAVCCAALEAGATRVLRLGGPHAIAAMAYGTRLIRRVEKIVGPGSAWVTSAKALVSVDAAIDFHAGPSEIVVWSDRGRPDWIAADLVAQAEHDPDARALFVTTRPDLAREVVVAARRMARGRDAAGRSLKANGAAIVTGDRDEAADIVNRIAPEHLVCDTRSDAGRVSSAGTIFVGRWSAQAAGDYSTGSNHVLPTGGAARFRGGLSAADFVRVFNVQTISRAGLNAIGPAAVALARAEGLTAHAESIQCRLGRTDRRHSDDV